VTAAATALGAVPLLLSPQPSRRWLGLANGLAAGFMVGASLGLLASGWDYGIEGTLAGALVGAAFIAVTRALLGRRRELHIGAFSSSDTVKMLMIVGIMTVHSFAEGIGIGVSFGGGQALGVVIAIAIAVHNIPEGLAICLVLVPRGVPVGRAAWWSLVSSLPQPLMAVPAFLFVEEFEPFLPVGLGFAAGAMLWMVTVELLPEAVADAPARTVAAFCLAAAAALVALQVMLP
jgi:zinc transporter ZupT